MEYWEEVKDWKPSDIKKDLSLPINLDKIGSVKPNDWHCDYLPDSKEEEEEEDEEEQEHDDEEE